MIADLSELLALHDSPGEAFAGEVLFQIGVLIPRHGIDVLLSELSEKWRRALITWLVEAYDNTTPIEEYIFINDPTGPDRGRQARAWMKRNPTYRDEVIDDVATLVALTRDRIFSRDDLMHQLVRLSASQGAEAVARQLPPSEKEKFVDWGRAHLLDADASTQSPGEREVRGWLLTH